MKAQFPATLLPLSTDHHLQNPKEKNKIKKYFLDLFSPISLSWTWCLFCWKHSWSPSNTSWPKPPKTFSISFYKFQFENKPSILLLLNLDFLFKPWNLKMKTSKPSNKKWISRLTRKILHLSIRLVAFCLWVCCEGWKGVRVVREVSEGLAWFFSSSVSVQSQNIGYGLGTSIVLGFGAHGLRLSS